FVAGANGQPIERRETPGVLQPQGVRSGLAEGIAGDCSGGAVDPVRGGVNGIDQLIKVVMRTEGYLMRAVQSLRPPVTLEVERRPSGVVHGLDRSRAAPFCRRQRGSRHAYSIVAKSKIARHHFPVPFPLRVRPDRYALRDVLLIPVVAAVGAGKRAG